ncbi:MAG TPA: response regulator [Verrucomicrobiae bacterium]|jgi:PAS domain S-box-containing protein|nr:response regulator [Verrucomicrobiae bacterium]
METAPVKVLLIDDEENSFILLRRMLGKVPDKKFVMEWAPDYAAGLTALESRRHDVCLLDYRLGPETGLDLLREAVARGVATPMIILTGSDDPKVDLEATALGASDFMLKDSLDPIILERVIRYSIQHAATLAALKKSNERFRLLFERSLDAILISNNRGELIEANSAACNLLGMEREKLLELKWSDLLVKALRQTTEPRADLGEVMLRRPDGAVCVIEYSSTQLAAGLNLSILRDVTERRRLEGEIQEISEREQRRLGQDLHDGLGQSMTGIACLAKVLQQRLAGKNSAESEAAGNIATLIHDALAQTRRISRGLCPVVLDTNDIEAALEQLAENLRAMFSVNCELQCSPGIEIADNAMAVHLYRIAQEAATNAIKHGKAKSIALSFLATKSRLILRIKDDGQGFSPEASKGKGMGMRVMHHRARMIGASISIREPKEGGITVTCSLRRPQVSKRALRRKLASRQPALANGEAAL